MWLGVRPKRVGAPTMIYVLNVDRRLPSRARCAKKPTP